jgi:class 3 adenylate cyclase
MRRPRYNASASMRCPRCRHENRAIASFCDESGGPLARPDACPRCATANPPGHRFCDGCGAALLTPRASDPTRALPSTPAHLADKIRRDRGGLEGERKLVTVLFADVVHSMEIAERVDPEDWHRILDRFFQILAAGVHRFEGTVNHFSGDGLMALFGAPIAHEDHARRACHAALDLREALGDYASVLAARGLGFAVRMGINSGEVVLGRIGDDLHVEYTALGHTVGLAARMEQMAAPGTVYLTEHTARLVDGFFTLRDVGTPAMKGVSVPVRVYELVAPGSVRTRLEASRRRGFSRLVGREGELARLWRVLEEAVAGRGQVVGMVGDAGVGKSRLCLEFVERCRAQGIAVHEAHCPAHGAGVPLLPIRQLVRSLLALDDDAPEADVVAVVRTRLAPVDAELAASSAVVLDVLGIADPDEDAAAHAERPPLRAVIGRLVRTMAAPEPLVLLIDDAHWIDPASDEVVHEIAGTAHATRTLVLANFRAGYDLCWTTDTGVHQMPLAPLGHGAAQALLAELLGDDVSTAALAALIEERTGGNPLFIEELVQALAACGSLAGRPGAYRLTAPLQTLAIPDSIQSLLAARIDRLGAEAKDVLATAAVIGKQFEGALLLDVAGLDERTLAAAIAALESGELIQELPGPQPTRYAFSHPLTQEVAYHALLADRRARLHGAVAGAIERLSADRLGEHAELIAHHWNAAGMRYEAARWHRRAALRVSSIKLAGRGRGVERRPC